MYGEKRSWVITRSNWFGTGKYTGHWLGDNYATWEQLASSVNGMLDMNMFGITYTGADICGFFDGSGMFSHACVDIFYREAEYIGVFDLKS